MDVKHKRLQEFNSGKKYSWLDQMELIAHIPQCTAFRGKGDKIHSAWAPSVVDSEGVVAFILMAFYV